MIEFIQQGEFAKNAHLFTGAGDLEHRGNNDPSDVCG